MTDRYAIERYRAGVRRSPRRVVECLTAARAGSPARRALSGTRVMQATRGHDSLRLIALTRARCRFRAAVRMEMMVADPARWPEAVAYDRPRGDDLWRWARRGRKAGSEEAFRAVDHDLVLALAPAARKAEVPTSCSSPRPAPTRSPRRSTCA
jgi:hypothetical protein